MKRNLLIGSVVLLAGSLFAADSSPKDDVLAAAKKLAAKDNYSWKITSDFGAASQFPALVSDMKTEKDGYTWLSFNWQDNPMEGVMKTTNNIAVKTEEGWKSGKELMADAGGGGGGGFGNPGIMTTRRLQNLRTPAAEVEDLVGKVKELKKDGDAYSGELTPEGANSLLTFGFGGRRGQAPPPATGAKGSVKFWIKDGVISKYESKASGKREFQGEERDVERNTTVEIKDVGTTKISVPEDAKKKLS